MSEMIYYRDLNEQLLVFPVLGNLVGIELKYVKSIDLISELIPIPRSPNYVLGIVNIDGNIYPVLDLDVLLSGGNQHSNDQVIISLIDLKDTVFGIHTHQLPSVVPGAVNGVKSELKTIPEEWVKGFTEHEKYGKLPIIDPKQFWIGMGENQVVGPSLDAKIHPENLIQEEAEDNYSGESQIENDFVTEDVTSEEESYTSDVMADSHEVDETIVEDVQDLLVEEDIVEVDGENVSDDLSLFVGISDKVKEDLIEAGFSSREDIINAKLSDLMAINGIGKKTAENLKATAEGLSDDENGEASS